METLDQWWARGTHARVSDPRTVDPHQAPLHVFERVLGEGPWLTLLHGFPSSSWDYAPIAPRLASTRRLLAFDFIGFGDSSKPTRRGFGLLDQADLTEELWRRHGVRETDLVAHDYGASVALELLARQAEGRLATRVRAVLLMNAGLYLDLYRPRLVQRLLRLPVLGALIARALGPRRFRRSFSAVFAPAHRPSEAELAQHWEALARRAGQRQAHRLIRYIDERHLHRARWEQTLERDATPMGFVWGLLDPVSGAPIAARLRERRPQAPFCALADVGHYPQLEAPERTADAILSFLGEPDQRA